MTFKVSSGTAVQLYHSVPAALQVGPTCGGAAVRGTVYISTVNFNHCILLIQTLGSGTSARGIAELETAPHVRGQGGVVFSAAWESVAIAILINLSLDVLRR